MSALEPDAPAQHVWPVWRAAVRDWVAGRNGRKPAKASFGNEPRGKSSELGDRLAVGRVFAELGLVVGEGRGTALTEQGELVVEVAFEKLPRDHRAEGGSVGLSVLINKVERRLRAAGLIKPASPRTALARFHFRDTEGQEHHHSHLVDSD